MGTELNGYSMPDEAELARIERVARAATPGPWTWTELGGGSATHLDSVRNAVERERVIMAEPIGDSNSSICIETADAHHIAEMNPARTLEIVDAIRRYKRRIVHLECVLEALTSNDNLETFIREALAVPL